ncbi:MAG: ATP-binding protein [Gammaproteobacteria bacterium]|nr:ATP-binding protein [Gammaproteobacteria bacterium]
MNNDTNVLFVSASAADETVLETLLAKNGTGDDVTLSTASEAQHFFDAVYSEMQFQVIVVDDVQEWSDWRSVVEACKKHRPNALLVLLVSSDAAAQQCSSLLADGLAAVYPRNSSGLLALARLVSTLAAQSRSFSLRLADSRSAAHAGDETEEERERLVYAVSHDLQDPLQLARRYAAILNEDFERELGDSGSKVLNHLEFNLNRTQEMLDELLEYSRLQSARPERTPVDLNVLLDEVIALYQLTLDEIGGTISKQHDLPTLIVDRRQFHRVFQNLIGNAIKFRSERPLHITVRAQRIRNEWRIGLKDNGIGIAEEDTKRIFGMFERAAPGEDYPGTGMGLAICKRIITNHGGKIWVRSSLGSGSVFIFSIPQADDAGTESHG